MCVCVCVCVCPLPTDISVLLLAQKSMPQELVPKENTRVLFPITIVAYPEAGTSWKPDRPLWAGGRRMIGLDRNVFRACNHTNTHTHTHTHLLSARQARHDWSVWISLSLSLRVPNRPARGGGVGGGVLEALPPPPFRATIVLPWRGKWNLLDCAQSLVYNEIGHR